MFREAVEENLQKMNGLGCGSVILIGGYWNPSWVRGGRDAG